MTTRNPMNERNTDAKPKGTTRKSASSAKPKREVAGSVVVVEKTKGKAMSKAEAKAARREADAKRRETERKYYNPPTEEYRNARRMWWAIIVAAILCSLASWFGMSVLPEGSSLAFIVLAYILIIAAIVLDLTKIKNIRRRYIEQMAHSKEESRSRKAETAAKKSAAEVAAEEKPEEKKGFFSKLFGKK